MQSPLQEKRELENLSVAQRVAGLYTDGLMLLLLAFFAYHHWKSTGLFTEKFGWAEMIALYVPILISLAPPLQRLIQGRRNPARPLEAATDLSLAIGSFWLWTHFPFNFAHLADPFPAAMRFAFAWITNNVGRWILLLQVIIGIISSLSTIFIYISKERTEAK
jgi:hypothetical protein